MLLPFMPKGKIWARGVVLGYWRKGVVFHKDGTISSILDYFVNIYVDNCSVSLWTGKSYSVNCMYDLIQTMFGRKRFVKQLCILASFGVRINLFFTFWVVWFYFFFCQMRNQIGFSGFDFWILVDMRTTSAKMCANNVKLLWELLTCLTFSSLIFLKCHFVFSHDIVVHFGYWH